jgi:hypothetical protein
MFYQYLIACLALIATGLSSPLPDSRLAALEFHQRRASLTWPEESQDRATPIVKRDIDEYVTLDNGNQCEIRASSGSTTTAWRPADFANMFDLAGRTLSSSISRNNSPQVSVTFSFRDHNGNTHQVEAYSTSTGRTSVSIQGAYDNVNRAFLAAEELADAGNPGLMGTTRTTFGIFFGQILAISVGLNILN